MAVTYTATINRVHVVGDQKVMDVSFSANGSYATGGDTLAPASVGLDVIDFIVFTPDSSAGAGTPSAVVWSWNSSTGKIMMYVQGTAGATNTMIEANGATITT